MTILAQSLCGDLELSPPRSRATNSGMPTPNSQVVEITALITAAPGREQELRHRLRDVVALTQAEPGCLVFEVFERLDAPGEFVLWERFANRAAFAEHVQAPYTVEYFRSGAAARTQAIHLQRFA
jgi:quinol monooxygenase YgiN